MNTLVKILGFVVGLAAVFGIALGVGHAFGPVADPAPAAQHDGMGQKDAADGSDEMAAAEGSNDEMAGMDMTADALPAGLMVSEHGYGLELARTAPAGQQVPISFRIIGPDGAPVTTYDVEHEKQLHLIAVRRDFTGFQHVHPVLDANGTWTTKLDLTPGTWRVFADFKASGADALTLGTDVAVAGDYRPVPPAAESRTSTVDGYTVTLHGDLAAGAEAKLRLDVSRNGRPVTDLQPYLGAYGHLVALREGDLAYLHVHPDGEPGDGTTRPGPAVVFHASVPSTGRYRLYLNFQHQGVVRTAAFTVATGSRR